MATIDELLDDTRRGLARPFRLPHEAAASAMNMFLLTRVYHLADDPRVVELQERYREALGDLPPEEVLANQLDYASRLAASPGPLLYEEMHKLFSLADEIHALRSLGYVTNDALVQRFESNLRARFATQRKHARLVAQDRAEGWNRELWWYKENLS